MTAVADDGSETRFETIARLDTEVEVDYYRNGGILQTISGSSWRRNVRRRPEGAPATATETR